MFVAFRDPRIFQRLRNLGPNRVCKESNQFLVQRARRFVFSSDESQRDFIVSHMSTKMEQQPFFPRAASLIAA
jgi:hypothetical protein